MRYEPSRERGTGSTRGHEATGRFSATFACRQANIVELHSVHALRVELRTKPRVWFERDDRDFQHPGFGKRQRPELLAHARLGISLHEQAGAGDIRAVPDLPDEALGVERTRSRDFIRDT
jgi:hypothetical protein